METKEPILSAIEIITVAAVLLGPIIAVQLSQLLDRVRLKRGGKEWIFKTLMRTRASTLSPAHVEALNMIDVEFYGSKKKNKRVVAAWKLYLDNLGDMNTPEDIRYSKRGDLFLELLYTMAASLGYDFDKEHIKNTSYIPQAFVDVESEQHMIRKGVLNVLRGDTTIPMRVTNHPDTDNE